MSCRGDFEIEKQFLNKFIMKPLDRHISREALASDQVMAMAGGCFSWQPTILPEHRAIMEDGAEGRRAAEGVEWANNTRPSYDSCRADDALGWLFTGENCRLRDAE